MRGAIVGMSTVAVVVLHVMALHYGASRVSPPVAIAGGVIVAVVTAHLIGGRRQHRRRGPRQNRGGDDRGESG